MKLSEIKNDVEKYIDQEVTVEGWIRQQRFTKNVGFIELNDGTIFKNLQVVVGKDLENFGDLQKEHLSASLKVVGKFVKTNNAKQAYELQANKVEVLGHSDEKFPIQKQKQSLEYMRTIPHLRVRTNTYRAVFRLRSKLAYALHKFFQEREFIYLNAPLITASDTEGAGEMFQVTTQDLDKPNLDKEGKVDYTKDFFGKKSYLTVSGQLEAEDYALALSNIYTFGPTFRAEESNTPRHAAEFWMLEPELAFADYNVCMDVAEEIKRSAFKITRAGELMSREAARRLGVAKGIVDLSLAPTPAAGDSVARILEIIGVGTCGGPGTTCALALLNDCVKKGGVMASSSVGGLSGAFIPVSEDMGMIAAVEAGALSLEKLEAMTCVCSVGLDMIAIPGDTPVEAIAGIIADEMAIGVINNKTTAVRLIPAIGHKEGDILEYGGLFGSAPVMPVNPHAGSVLAHRGGRFPAPLNSLKN